MIDPLEISVPQHIRFQLLIEIVVVLIAAARLCIANHRHATTCGPENMRKGDIAVISIPFENDRPRSATRIQIKHTGTHMDQSIEIFNFDTAFKVRFHGMAYMENPIIVLRYEIQVFSIVGLPHHVNFIEHIR